MSNKMYLQSFSHTLMRHDENCTEYINITVHSYLRSNTAYICHALDHHKLPNYHQRKEGSTARFRIIYIFPAGFRTFSQYKRFFYLP